MKLKLISIFIATLAAACNSNDDSNTTTTSNDLVVSVDPSLFLTNSGNVTVTKVPCTLSEGTVTDCYEIVTTSTPTDHEMGPWCPENIADDASKGGIWLENGEVYDVDGAFIENMATFYNDTKWKMYDANGDIYTTETEEDCANAANPNVGEEYENFCVECLPSYLGELTQTYRIPATPVKQSSAYSFGGAPGPPGSSSGPSQRGVAFNGVVFDAPAPTDAILGAYTLAPFDDAGGHINLNAGYHYHATTGVSTQITQEDDHAAQIGYAMDGHGLYAQLDANGNESTDLDECRGHTDSVRGYHYHADDPGSNNFIDCLYGAYVN
ncbi:MAG: YHYH protein [Cellulophaga fucicola]